MLQRMTSLISQQGLNQLSIFIFVLAVMQIVYSVLTMALGRAKVSQSRFHNTFPFFLSFYCNFLRQDLRSIIISFIKDRSPFFFHESKGMQKVDGQTKDNKEHRVVICGSRRKSNILVKQGYATKKTTHLSGISSKSHDT